MQLPPRRPTNDTTQLAKERNRQAAERTVTSWIQNSLLLIGFGTALQEISAALKRSYPQQSAQVNLELTHTVSLSAIAAGILLLIPILLAHHSQMRALERENYLENLPSLLNLYLIVVGSVILFGLVALAAVVLVVSQK